MVKLCIFVGTVVGGYGGWWLGSQFGGFMFAFFTSSLGSVIGIIAGWKIGREYFD